MYAKGSALSPVTGCGRQSRSYVDRRDNRINHHKKGAMLTDLGVGTYTAENHRVQVPALH